MTRGSRKAIRATLNEALRRKERRAVETESGLVRAPAGHADIL